MNTLLNNQPLPLRRNRWLQFLLVWIACLWVITAISPVNRLDWFLENLLVFVYGAILISTYKEFRFSNLSYTLFIVFLSMHLVGAHYTYTMTPAGDWAREAFALQRNHYDRFVHFCYGFLCAYPFHELVRRCTAVRPSWAYFLAVCMILSFSAFFEVLEAVIAVIVSPESGDLYLGTQGDVWDAQFDMFLALSGSLIAMLATWLWTRMISTRI